MLEWMQPKNNCYIVTQYLKAFVQIRLAECEIFKGVKIGNMTLNFRQQGLVQRVADETSFTRPVIYDPTPAAAIQPAVTDSAGRTTTLAVSRQN